MKKKDLRIGYVVKTRNGNLYMVMPSDEQNTLILSRPEGWENFSSFNDDLTIKRNSYVENSCFDIMEVYGLSSYKRESTLITTEHRKLLWKREETKKMTVAEIEDILGYKIEVVSES